MSIQSLAPLLIVIFLELGFSLPIFAMETIKEAIKEEKKSGTHIPEDLAQYYKKVDIEEKNEIDKLYNETRSHKLEFVGRNGRNTQEYNESFFKCIGKENDYVEEFSVTHNMGPNLTKKLLDILPKYSALRKLDISGNRITDAAIKKYLTPFENLPKLTHLSLASNDITYAGFLHLFKLSNRGLVALELQKNHIELSTAVNFLREQKEIKFKELYLYEQRKVNALFEITDVQKEISILYAKFPSFSCVLSKKDEFINTQSILPLYNLIVAAFVDDSKLEIDSNEKRPLPGSNSPIIKNVLQNNWSSKNSNCIMAIDPSGEGCDATGYAVIKVNKNGEYLIKKAGGIKGDGLSNETFKELINVSKKENVNYVVIESNYHQKAYATAFGFYYELQERDLLMNEGKNVKNYLEETKPKFSIENWKTEDPNKGERIVRTIKPLLESQKLFIEKEFFTMDWENRTTQPSLYQEMSWMKEDFKSEQKKDARHDDLIDALEIAISFSKSLSPSQVNMAQNLAAVFSNDSEKKPLTNQKIAITDDQITQIVKLIHESTGKNNSTTLKYIGIKSSSVVTTLMNGNAKSPSFDTVRENFKTPEKVRASFSNSQLDSKIKGNLVMEICKILGFSENL